MLHFTVRGIALEQKSRLPLVLLHNRERNLLLPLPIGPFEASAIIVEMESVHPPRPLTHDLLAQMFIKHNFTLTTVEIYACLEDSQLARIKYRSKFASHSMEVRPSDGIALAIRLDAPILLSESVVHKLAEGHELLYSDDLSNSEILYLESHKPQVTLM